MKSPDPNNFFSKRDLSIQDAIEAQRPIPPWKRTKLKALKQEQPIIQQPTRRKWLYIFLAPMMLIEWAIVLIFNIVEKIADSIKEITLALETYINAKAEPTGLPPTD